MEITKERARAIFLITAPKDKGIRVTAPMIDDAERNGHINPEEADLLRQAYNIQKCNNCEYDDNPNTMELEEYLRALSTSIRKGLFNDAEIRRADREAILNKVEKDHQAIRDADPALQNDRDFLFDVLCRQPLALPFIEGPHLDYFMKNENIALMLIKKNWGVFKFLDKSLTESRAFVLKAVNEHGMVLTCTNRFTDDKEIVRKAVSNCGIALMAVPPRLRTKELVLIAVRNDGYALEFAPANLQGDKDVVREAAKECRAAFRYASAALKKDRVFVLEIVGYHGDSLEYADPTFRADREIVLKAVREEGGALEYADASLRGDEEVVMAAVRQNGRAIKYVDPSIRSYEAIALEAIKEDWGAFESIKSGLRDDPVFQEKAFNVNFNIFKYLNNPSLSIREEYERIRTSLAALNIEFCHRLSTRVAKEVIRNREHFDPSDKRPVAVLIFAKSDKGDVFSRVNDIDAVMDHGYKVVYFEVSMDTDLSSAVREVGSKQGISLLVIGGHGEQQNIMLGDDPNAKDFLGDKKSYIDFSDESKLKNLAHYLCPDSAVVLVSCSTGKGGGKYNRNIADLMKSAFPQAKIFAPTDDSFDIRFVFNKHNLLKDVIYNKGTRADNRKTYSLH